VASVETAGDRRKAKKKGSARLALLDAAGELFIEREGVEPSVIDIAQRAGVNTGLIGYYFGSKDSLLTELLHRNLDHGTAQIDLLVKADLPVVTKLKMNISGVISTHCRYPYNNQLLRSLVGRSRPDEALALTDKFLRPLFDGHSQLLAAGVASGELRSFDPMLFYYTIIGACDRIFSARYSLRTLFAIGGVDEDLKRKLIAHTIDIVLPGILSDRELRRYLDERETK